MTALDADQLRSLLDRETIREQLFRYSRGIDRSDADLIAAVYWPDAVDEHGALGRIAGTDCASRLLEANSGVSEASQHCLCNILIDLDGDEAYVESYFLNFLTMNRDGREATRTMGGRYVDRFERRHGEWRIAHRVLVHDWSRVDEILEAWERRKGFEQGQRGRDDLVYRLRNERALGQKPV